MLYFSADNTHVCLIYGYQSPHITAHNDDDDGGFVSMYSSFMHTMEMAQAACRTAVMAAPLLLNSGPIGPDGVAE